MKSRSVIEGALIDIIIIIIPIKTLIDKEAKNFKDNGLLMFGQVFLEITSQIHTFLNSI